MSTPTTPTTATTTTTAEGLLEAQKVKAIEQIANISKLLRDAIDAALPVAPEQYLTIAVPGTTIDTRDINDNGTFVYDSRPSAFAPTQVMQAEAKLVDNMVPLSYVMIGTTGKSVGRSYTRALDTLVPRKANVSTGKGGGEIRSPGSTEYDQAMKYLTTVDKDTGKTKMDVYIEKQRNWAGARNAWDQAKGAAKTAAIQLSDEPVEQLQYFNDWNQDNYRQYKFAVQARYMDWVSNGYKYEVEQNFGIVDVDSIMGRLEESKESVRNSTVVDVDGSNEVQLVELTPKNWATLCKNKADGWYRRNGEFSLEQVDAEIDRLGRLLISYKAMSAAMGFAIVETPDDIKLGAQDPTKVTYPVAPTAKPDTTTNDTALQAAYADLYAKQAALSAVVNKLTVAKSKDITAEAEWKTANDAVNKSRADLSQAIAGNDDVHKEHDKWVVTSMQDKDGLAAVSSWLGDTLSRMKANINKLGVLRGDKVKTQPPKPPVIASATATSDDPTMPNGTIVSGPGDENPDEAFGITQPNEDTTDPQAGSASDPWTTISASFSASDQTSTSSTSSWGMSLGGSAGWGLWSAGGNYSHDESKTDFSSDMAACDVSLTFSCLVVSIRRPWLYGELFADAELDTANGVYLSPGAQQLQAWMKKQKKPDEVADSFDTGVVNSLAKYSMFPAYPTSFIVAADTTIEFHGNTEHLEKHFSSLSNSGSVSIGWGPFNVSSGFRQSSSSQSFQMQSTASGCRLTFGAPQIIGWVSQILPALPRLDGYEPMVQNQGTWKG